MTATFEFVRIEGDLAAALACSSCGKRRRVTIVDRSFEFSAAMNRRFVETLDPARHCHCPETSS